MTEDSHEGVRVVLEAGGPDARPTRTALAITALGRDAIALRDEQIAQLYAEGVSVEELARLFDRLPSTILERLARARAAPSSDPPTLIVVDRDEHGHLRERHIRLAPGADPMAVVRARFGNAYTRRAGQELTAGTTVLHLDAIYGDDPTLETDERIDRLHHRGANAEAIKRIVRVASATVQAVAEARGWKSVESEDDE